MNWLTNFIRPKIRSMVEQKDVPDNLWQKCDACEGMLFHRDLTENMSVCYHCGYHMRIPVMDRLRLMFDEGRFREVAAPSVLFDPLKFKDRKRYSDRLKETRSKLGRNDAIIIASGTMGDLPVVIAAFDFAFMGGSMGAAVGEGLVLAADTAVRQKAALIAIPASGGARMQEGALSLMQMPRTIVAVEQVKAAGLPYIVLLTDPTTGGVSASFAMVGDIHIAEPGCMIGFAGKRVIQETIREALPDDFQTAEYLRAHGMVDMVIARKDIRGSLIRILGILFHKNPSLSLNKGDSRTSEGRNGISKNGGKKKDSGSEPRALAKIKKTLKAKPAANTNGGNARGKKNAG